MSQLKNITLLDELFMEAFAPTETLILEIFLPGSLQHEFGINRELDAIGKRIEACIRLAKIPGIKESVVKRSKDAEIILEIEYQVSSPVTANQRRGNLYRDRIGEKLKECSHLFTNIKIEGAKNVNNHIGTGLGARFIDIRMIDKISGKPVNIEMKRSKSIYHSLQKQKDSLIEKAGQGQTYVVRGTPKRRGR